MCVIIVASKLWHHRICIISFFYSFLFVWFKSDPIPNVWKNTFFFVFYFCPFFSCVFCLFVFGVCVFGKKKKRERATWQRHIERPSLSLGFSIDERGVFADEGDAEGAREEALDDEGGEGREEADGVARPDACERAETALGRALGRQDAGDVPWPHAALAQARRVHHPQHARAHRDPFALPFTPKSSLLVLVICTWECNGHGDGHEKQQWWR